MTIITIEGQVRSHQLLRPENQRNNDGLINTPMIIPNIATAKYEAIFSAKESKKSLITPVS